MDIKAKRQRRENFKQIFVKRLVGTFLVTTLVVLFSTFILLQIALYSCDAAFYTEMDYSVASINDVYDSMLNNGFTMDNPQDMKEYYSRLKFRFYANEYMSTALLDGETLEPIWSGEEIGIAVMVRENVEDEKYLYYELDGEVPEGYRNIYMYVQSESMYADMGKEPVDQLEGIYIKDRSFKLGKATLTEYDKRGNKVVKEYDFTPEDTAGYTYIEDDENARIMFAGVFGSPVDSALYNKMQEYIREMSVTENNGYVLSQYVGAWDMEQMSNSRVFLPDGSSIVICKVLSINLLEIFGKQIVIAYIIIYTVVLAFATLFARLKYLKLKATYDMEDYRITMTNTMAHDLKSPLMSISGYAENLKANINTDKKEYYADSILENVEYMNDIIANVLELSKVETGQLKLNKTEIIVEELITEVADHYRDAMKDKKLTLNVEGSLTIKADKVLMQQAMDNIIGNAVKYSKEDKTIEVALESGRGKGRIAVSNVSTQDIGKEAANLWKPFVKGDNSRSNKQGTGVGLAIVKNILELHGYSLKLSCEDGKFCVDIKI